MASILSKTKTIIYLLADFEYRILYVENIDGESIGGQIQWIGIDMYLQQHYYLLWIRLDRIGANSGK